ncbi:MAG: hypothetical protein PHN31_03510, partial [Candidatus Gracilibacteria bacterium]|nr:hypothetical protein [Candidatus Gracilibacteria bacterium]
MKTSKVFFYLFISLLQIFLFINHSFAVDIIANTTISSDTTYDSMVVKSGYTLTLDATLHVTGDVTIETGGKITHSVVNTTTSSNLIVGGTLNINPGGKYDVSSKGNNSYGSGSQYAGATHAGLGFSSSKNPYGDIYNPIDVGSYGYTSGRYGGGLVRFTASNLINNGSILANGNPGGTSSYGGGAGGSINIIVNGNISGTGIYQALGGGYYSYAYNGGGGRISIKYNSVSDLNTLKNNTSATGPGTAGEGTIYLKDNSTGYQLLMFKGDGYASSYGTSTSVDLNSFDDVIIDGAGLTISGFNWNIPKSFEIKNRGFLTTNASYPLSVSGTLTISSGSILTSNSPLTVDDLFLNNGTVTSASSISVDNNLTLSGGTLNSNNSLFVSNDFNFTSGTFNNSFSGVVSGNASIKGTFYNNSLFSVSGDTIILNGGTITHSVVNTTTSSNLIVGGTLNINPGGKYDVSSKGNNSYGSGS